MSVPDERRRNIKDNGNGSSILEASSLGVQTADVKDIVAPTPAKVTEQTGFVAKRWVQLPRDQEEPEREYLAKRRKGLSAGSGMPMRKTRVRRTDANGQTLILEVLLPEGQTVEGEIRNTTLESQDASVSITAPAPGTVIAGLGIANEQGVVVADDDALAPMRRRAPPPRRKPKKGPGRGRKKLALTEGTGVSASANELPVLHDGVAVTNAKTQDAADTVMEDPQDGEEDDEEEDEGDEEEGEEEDGEGLDGEGDGEGEGEVEAEGDGENGEVEVEGEGEGGEEDDDREEGELTPSPEPELRTTSAYPTQQRYSVTPAHPLPVNPMLSSLPLSGLASLPPKPVLSLSHVMEDTKTSANLDSRLGNESRV